MSAALVLTVQALLLTCAVAVMVWAPSLRVTVTGELPLDAVVAMVNSLRLMMKDEQGNAEKTQLPPTMRQN
jgi:hypothetical protein